MTNQLAPKIN